MTKFFIKSVLQEKQDRFAQAEQELSLAEWLEVSWFYPEGFVKEEIIETSNSWIILGNGIAYKFLKIPSPYISRAKAFKWMWSAACREISDNLILAPKLYIGLRLLRWLDGEPRWLSESTYRSVKPESPPKSVDDLAIVMRRIPPNRLLSNILENRKTISKTLLSNISRKIRKFHAREKYISNSDFPQNNQLVIDSLKKIYLVDLQSFIIDEGNCLDPFSRLCLLEVLSYLKQNLEMKSNIVLSKCQISGQQMAEQMIYVHGALTLDKIAIAKHRLSERIPIIIGRLDKKSHGRLNSYLSDLATLALSFEAAGYQNIARELEFSYFNLSDKKSPHPDYRFFKVAEASKKALNFWRSNSSTSSAQAIRYLSLAFRNTIGLSKPFLLALGGRYPLENLEISRSIQEMCFEPVVLTNIPEQNPAIAINKFEKLLLQAEYHLSSGKPVIICSRLNLEEDRLCIYNVAKKFDLPCLIVKCQKSKRTRQYNEDDIWVNHLKPHRIPELILDPILPPAELGLYILRQLAMSNNLTL